jgi:hypothetical protein
MENLRSIEERRSVLNDLLSDGTVVFKGKDLPDPEDPSDPSFTAMIYISGTGAGTETLYESGIVATGIPSVHVAYWDKTSIQYLKHWLFKVLDDPKIYRATEIKIQASKGWDAKLKQ